MSPAGGGTFLSLNKKVPKEVSLGEALTVKSIVTAAISYHFYPAFKPPSPKTPTRPLSAAGYKSFLRKLSVFRVGENGGYRKVFQKVGKKRGDKRKIMCYTGIIKKGQGLPDTGGSFFLQGGYG